MKSIRILALASLAFVSSASFAQTPAAGGSASQAPEWESSLPPNIVAAREVIRGYVDTRQRIAEARNSWEAEKQTIERRIEAYEQEREELLESTREAREATTKAETEIAARNATIQELNSALNIVSESLPSLEDRIRAIVRFLPEPLRNEIKPLVDQMGRGQTSQRMVYVIGILNAMDRFNNEYRLVQAPQNIEGSTQTMDVLYVGLAQAYYVNDGGTIGGIGYPTANGWVFEPANDLAPRIRSAVDYFTGDVKPALFVPLPVTVRDATTATR